MRCYGLALRKIAGPVFIPSQVVSSCISWYFDSFDHRIIHDQQGQGCIDWQMIVSHNQLLYFTMGSCAQGGPVGYLQVHRPLSRWPSGNLWCRAHRSDLWQLPQIWIYTRRNLVEIWYWWYCTSRTAQGGCGSFNNRKPIGRVGCCDSRMAERIHWWTERWLELCCLEWLQWLQWSPHHNCWM